MTEAHETAGMTRSNVQLTEVTRLVLRGCWLGEKVWFNADVYWRQQIAPHFLESWGTSRSVQPDVAVLLAERSGPK